MVARSKTKNMECRECGSHDVFERCSEYDCEKEVLAKGLCSKHYNQRWRKGYQFCSIQGCDNKQTRRGLCQKHYSRWRRTGNPRVDGRRKRNPNRKDWKTGKLMTEVEREEALQKKRAERAEKEEFEDDGFWDQVNSYTNYRLNSR